MAAGTYNISLEAGAGYLRVFTRQDDEGAPLPFAAGATAQFQARTSARQAGDPLLALAPVVDHEAGTVTLSMADADTRVFDIANVSSFVYAIEIHYDDAPSERFVEGTIKCSPEVVRD